MQEYRGMILSPPSTRCSNSNKKGKRGNGREKIRNNQIGFRKGKGTMDNIRAKFCNRQIAKKEGGMVVMLVDLKVAFDMVNREVLLDSMREKGLREELIGRVGEMVREGLRPG